MCAHTPQPRQPCGCFAKHTSLGPLYPLPTVRTWDGSSRSGLPRPCKAHYRERPGCPREGPTPVQGHSLRFVASENGLARMVIHQTNSTDAGWVKRQSGKASGDWPVRDEGSRSDACSERQAWKAGPLSSLSFSSKSPPWSVEQPRPLTVGR